MTDPVRTYYDDYDEAGRLERAMGQLERLRTRDILDRHLPPAPADIVDIGGGPGAYAIPLAAEGHRVHLLDLVPRHIDQARARAAEAGVVLASAQAGDARDLPFDDDVADVVLLLGPLYHLQDRSDRVAVLRQARRIGRPGALVAAAGISRYASLLDGLARELLLDRAFEDVVARDLESGQHDNPTGDPRHFTTAYFHEPGELDDEAREAGLLPLATLALEGPASLLGDVGARLADPERRAMLLAALRRAESVPALLGVSWHHLALSRVPGG